MPSGPKTGNPPTIDPSASTEQQSVAISVTTNAKKGNIHNATNLDIQNALALKADLKMNVLLMYHSSCALFLRKFTATNITFCELVSDSN